MNRACRSTSGLYRYHVVAVMTGALLASCSADSLPEAPRQQQSVVARTTPPPPTPTRPAASPSPALSGAGAQARENAKAFLRWAERSAFSQREEARAQIHAAANNPDIVDALAEEARQAQQVDHSRALVAIGILGETASPRAVEHLRALLWQELPTTGQLVDGEIIERSALEMIEAKAVSGLAYIKDGAAEQEVLRAVAEHPSFHVRAEAAAFYRANHGDTAATRTALAAHVRKGEERIIDRPMRLAGDTKDTVNKKLQDYLTAHPEIIPPKPVQLPPKEKKAKVEPPADPVPTQ